MTDNTPAKPTFALPPPHLPVVGATIAIEDADGQLVDERMLARVEELDDTIFDALEGDAAALNRAADLWRSIRDTAPATLTDESREQYIRRAEAIAVDEYSLQPAATLAKRFAALEVLAIMAE